MNSLYTISVILAITSSFVSAQFGGGFLFGGGQAGFQSQQGFGTNTGLNFADQQQAFQNGLLNVFDQNNQAIDAATNQQAAVNNQEALQAGERLLNQEALGAGSQTNIQNVNQLDGAASQSEASSTKLLFEDANQLSQNAALSGSSGTAINDQNFIQAGQNFANDGFLNAAAQNNLQAVDQNRLGLLDQQNFGLQAGEQAGDAQQTQLSAFDQAFLNAAEGGGAGGFIFGRRRRR